MTRRLYRSRADTVLGGVAAGLAHYLNADPALVRIAWAILVPITGGAAFVAYIVAWIVVPEEPLGASTPSETDDASAVEVSGTSSTSSSSTSPRTEPDGGRAGLVVGIGLVLIGVWFLVRDYLPDIDWNLLWPVILIGVGGLILISSARRKT